MADDDWDDAPAKAIDVMALGGMEPAAELPEIKLFGKWSCDEVNVSDMSLQVLFLPLQSLQTRLFGGGVSDNFFVE